MASIEKPIGEKKSSISWFIPVFILMLIGFPFMRYAFSPLPILPADVQCEKVSVSLDGDHTEAAQQQIAFDELVEILSQSPRERRPINRVEGKEEMMELRIQTKNDQASSESQEYVLRFYRNSSDGIPVGFLDIGQFSYQIQNAAVLEAKLRSVCKPVSTSIDA